MPAVTPDQIPPLRRDARILTWVLASSLSRTGDVGRGSSPALDGRRRCRTGQSRAVMGIRVVPRAAILLLGGAYADRLDARRTISWRTSRIAVLVAAIVVVESGQTTIALLLVVAVVFGLVDGLYNPASARCRASSSGRTTWLRSRRCSSWAAASPPSSAPRSAACWSRRGASRPS